MTLYICVTLMLIYKVIFTYKQDIENHCIAAVDFDTRKFTQARYT